MKRNFKLILTAAVIILIAASSAGAQSVWSGNASVGLPSDFTAVSSMPQAASNTFPAGTVLEVINPGTGLSVEVEVTGRVNSPGVFILIDTDAALSIGLPADLVVPVRVSPRSLGSVEQLTSGLNGDAAFTSDIDYNPAAVFADSSDIPITAEEPPEEPVIPEESPLEPAVPQELEDEPVIPEESSEEPAVPEEPPAVPIILEEPPEEPLIPAAPELVPETPEPLPDAVLVSSDSFASSMPPDPPETLEHMGGKEKKSPSAPKFTASPPAHEPPPALVAPAVPEEPPASVREEAVPPPPPAEPNFGPPESIIAFNLAEAEAEEPPIEKTIIEETDTEEPDIEELIIKEPEIEEPEIEEPEIEDVIPETAPVQEPSDTITEAAPLPPPADEESERTVYFLTPSDLRPPEAPPTPPEPPAPPAEPDTAAPPDEPAVPEDDASDEPLEIPLTAMQRLTPPDSRPYVQIGAYRDPALLNQAALEFTHQAPGYPLSYAADTDESGAVYRLLIGPLQPAERGAVLKTARSSIFPDAFPYTP